MARDRLPQLQRALSLPGPKQRRLVAFGEHLALGARPRLVGKHARPSLSARQVDNVPGNGKGRVPVPAGQLRPTVLGTFPFAMLQPTREGRAPEGLRPCRIVHAATVPHIPRRSHPGRTRFSSSIHFDRGTLLPATHAVPLLAAQRGPETQRRPHVVDEHAAALPRAHIALGR